MTNVVYTEVKRIEYRAKGLSKATFFNGFIHLVTLLLPLLVAHRTYGLWRKIDFYIEQPDLVYKHKVFLLLSEGDKSLIWTSDTEVNSLLQEYLRSTLIKSYGTDKNYDGKQDEFHMSITVPLRNESVTSVTLILWFDCYLYKMVSLKMEGLIYMEEHHFKGANKLQIVGDIKLSQKEPFMHRGKDERFVKSPLDLRSFLEYDHDTFAKLSSYLQQNASIQIQNKYSLWSPAKDKNVFNIEVALHINNQLLIYRPGFWQILKWFWVQYLPIMLIFMTIFKKLRAYVYQNNILPTIKTIDNKLL